MLGCFFCKYAANFRRTDTEKEWIYVQNASCFCHCIVCTQTGTETSLPCHLKAIRPSI